jgi:uncharacterized protein YybS (DUF2232 family)
VLTPTVEIRITSYPGSFLSPKIEKAMTKAINDRKRSLSSVELILPALRIVILVTLISYISLLIAYKEYWGRKREAAHIPYFIGPFIERNFNHNE